MDAKNKIIYTIIIDQLASSDYIIRNRALQFICDNKTLFWPVKRIIEPILINYLEIEDHPKVLRWLAYTLAIIEGGEQSITAIRNKLKVVTEDHVIEWLIASLESLLLTADKNTTFPAELLSDDSFHIGIVKSWAYKIIDGGKTNLLVKGLNHQNPNVRKWAALSIGRKKIANSYIKGELKSSFDDDDYLVREWSMFALKDVADDTDFKAYAFRLEKEPHLRVREWAVKSLPYTLNRDVPDLLITELKGEHYKKDSLYAEAVLSTLSTYSDQLHVKSNIKSAIYESNEDIILLAAINGIRKRRSAWGCAEYSQCLISAYERAKNISVKRQIGLHLMDIYSETEQTAIRDILTNEIKSNILKTIVVSNLDPVITKLLMNGDGVISNEEQLFLVETKNVKNLTNKEPPNSFEGIKKGGALIDEIISDVVTGHKFKNYIIITKEVVVGDQYKTGQAGSVGPQSHSQGNTFNQVWIESLSNETLKSLTDELSKLRIAMRGKSTEADHDIAVSEIAQAEKAALRGDRKSVISHLKAAGKWALDAATEIGTTLAAEALKKSLNM